MVDHLKVWREVREQVDWSQAPAMHSGGDHDGVVEFVMRQRDSERADRLLAALDDVRSTVEPLTFAVLASWQRHLGVDTNLRTSPAFAKKGREQYGVFERETFDECLRQSADPAVPLSARTARCYLDVAFFHPFPDGNGRAAMLALYFVLTRENVLLANAAPALLTVRRADDGDGALDLARLLAILTRPRRGAVAREPRTRR